MIGWSRLNYEILSYTISCEPDCESICEKGLCNLDLLLKVCSILPVENFDAAAESSKILERYIKLVEGSVCPTFYNFGAFQEFDKNSFFHCGASLHHLVRNRSVFEDGISVKTREFIKKWTGDVLVIGIIADMVKNCSRSTLMWNINVLSVPSLPHYSSEEPVRLALQTSWKINEENVLFKESQTFIFINNMIENSTYQAYSYSSLFAQMQVSVSVHCQPSFFLTGCWLYCFDRHKTYTCNPDTGKEECEPGWFTSDTLYVDIKRPNFRTMPSVLVQHCDMVDDCYNTNCKDVCFSVGNGISVCLSSPLKFTPENLLVRPGESIKCSLESTNNQFEIPIRFTWQYVTSSNSANEAVSNMVMQGDTLYILKEASPSLNNLVKCLATDASGNIKSEEIRNYTIILNPTILRLNVTLQHVYLGDYVMCYSNAWPQDFFSYQFLVKSANSEILKYSSIIYIESFISLGEMLLNCSVTYMSGDNETSSLFRVFKLYVYVMRQFKWTNFRKPIFFVNDSAKIIVDINVPYEMELLQISGPTENLAINNTFIKFTRYCKGGHYRFIAMLYIVWQKSFLTFYRILDADLFEPLGNVRISEAFGYPHEIIYCNFNGHPYDFIQINFTLNSILRKELFHTNLNSIQIPENATISTIYYLICSAQMNILGANYSAMDMVMVSVKPRLKAYELNYIYGSYPLAITILSLLYLYIVFFFIFVTSYFVYFFYKSNESMNFYKTFVYYNHFRKAIRYSEKMSHMANVIMSMKKDGEPNSDLKLQLFYTYLDNTHRCSYSPGFGYLPEIPRQPPKMPTPPEKELDDQEESQNFYGIGPKRDNSKFRFR